MDSLIALINQQTFISRNFSTKILVVLYVIGIFNLIFGYFLNLVSVDLVATQPIDTIDTLSDLLNHERFKHFDVLTVGGVWHEEVLKSARINSPENQLWKRIPNENFIPAILGQEFISHALSYHDDVVNGPTVVVLDRQFIPGFRSVLCCFSPYLDYHRHHVSKDWFGERLLVPMISTRSDEKFISWIKYKYRQIFQSSLLQSLVQRSYIVITNTNESPLRSMRCAEGWNEEEKTPPQAFKFLFFLPLFFLCLCIMMISVIILILEIFLLT